MFCIEQKAHHPPNRVVLTFSGHCYKDYSTVTVTKQYCCI